MTTTEAMQEKLGQVGIPHKAIRCYGRQIVVTAYCLDSANQWASLLAKFSKVRNVLKVLDETKASEGQFRRKYVDVYRVFATV